MIDRVLEVWEYFRLTTVDDSMAKIKELMGITLPITSGLLATQSYYSKNRAELVR